MKSLTSANLHFSGLSHTITKHQINRMTTEQYYKGNNGTSDRKDGTSICGESRRRVYQVGEELM